MVDGQILGPLTADDQVLGPLTVDSQISWCAHNWTVY